MINMSNIFIMNVIKLFISHYLKLLGKNVKKDHAKKYFDIYNTKVHLQEKQKTRLNANSHILYKTKALISGRRCYYHGCPPW